MACSPVDGVALPGSIALNRGMARLVLDSARAMLVSEVPIEPPVNDWDIPSLEPIRAWLCVPLLGLEGQPIGVIQLYSSKFSANLGTLHDARLRWQDDTSANPPRCIPREFADLDRLSGLVWSLGLAIEFHHIERRVSTTACREIQATLNPAEHAEHRELPGYDVHRLFVRGQAYHAGFCEFISRIRSAVSGETPPGGTGVMGEMKGDDIKTALILADVQLEIRRLLMAGVELAEILMRVNWLLLDAGGEGIRVRAALAGLDSQAHRLTLASAGYHPLVVCHAGGFVENLDRRQEAVGPPLGSRAAPFYRAITVNLAPGDWVFLTSNVSMQNPADYWNGLGFEKQLGCRSPGAAMLRWVQQKAFGEPLASDETICCFGRTAE